MDEKLTWWQTPSALALVGFSTLVSTILTIYSVLQAREAVAKALESLTPPLYKVSGPRVSVVIPTLNEEDYLPLLLASIQNQTYEPIEVIVADSSTDSTPEIARAFGARVIPVEELNVSLARNAGAEAAQGDILVFCDADCILACDNVERLVRLLEAGAVLSHGSECIYDSAVRNFLSAPWRWAKPLTYTTGRGVAIRRAAFFEVGGYNVACDPTRGCREDLALGDAVLRAFGPGSVVRDRDAVVATSARRPIRIGGVWRERGWRDGVIPVEASMEEAHCG